MNPITLSRDPPQHPGRGPDPVAALAGGTDRPAIDLPAVESRQFLVMERAFAMRGGLVTGEELAGRMRTRHEQPISVLARWIVSRCVLSIAWRGQTLVPLFQFEPHDLSVRRSVGRVIVELRDVFDDWELALWFAQPNAWLGHASPLRMLDEDAAAVLQAARADRFIARG